MIRFAAPVFVALRLLIGCDEKVPAPETTEAPTPVTPAQVTPAPTPAALAAPKPVDVARLPVEEDFEQEAERELTAQNLVTKLDAIEKEIAAE